jgi:hypothetical protein
VTRSTTITPETFTLVPYDGSAIIACLDDVADTLGVPADVPLHLEVDEELFNPLVGTAADVTDGRIELWISGANLEDKKRPRHFDVEGARNDFAAMLLRAQDRLTPAFADAARDGVISRGERAAWDVWAAGRAERRGFPSRRGVRLYEFRLQHGFSDAADAEFERLWSAPDEAITWADIQGVCTTTGADQRAESRLPIDLLRQREQTPIAPR